MRRGDLYRVRNPSGDPKKSRVFVVVARAAAIESSYSTLICAPVFTNRTGISTQVDVGSDEGLKHASTIHCDNLSSIPRAHLTDYVGTLSPAATARLDRALRVALALE